MRAALLRYRVVAWIVGVVLIVLVLVAMPLKYLPARYGGDREFLVEAIGPVHGFLYMLYLVFAFALAQRLRWPLKRTVLLLVAGTVPFLSFLAERRVTTEVRARLTTQEAS